MLVQCPKLLLAVNYLLAVGKIQDMLSPLALLGFYGLITPGHLISRSRYATRNMHRSVETRQRKPDWVMNIQATQ